MGFFRGVRKGAEWGHYPVEAGCTLVRNGKNKWLKFFERLPPRKGNGRVCASCRWKDKGCGQQRGGQAVKDWSGECWGILQSSHPTSQQHRQGAQDRRHAQQQQEHQQCKPARHPKQQRPDRRDKYEAHYMSKQLGRSMWGAERAAV
eukprot:1151434-Pelagomonas_calceolata.AAC.1